MKITDKEIETALINGKAIKRKCWWDGWWFKLATHESFIDERGEYATLSFSEIIADDWEVVNE